MFSAIVLICAAALDERPCFTVKNDMFFDTYKECHQTVQAFIEAEVFVFINENGVVYDAVDHTCINWKAKKV